MVLFRKKKQDSAQKTVKLSKKKKRGPEHCNSLINTKVLNYREYYMGVKEKFFYGILAFVAGALIAYLMYGGIGSDENGDPGPMTHIANVVICVIVGIIAVKFFLPVRTEQLKRKRKNKLRQQFMDLLDSLASSVASGNNAVKAFEAAQADLMMQYGENSYIVDELRLILKGNENAIDISKMLADFGTRAGINEIESFAQVFALSYRKGGDFGKVIRDSYDILYNKISTEMEIETKIAATKNELNIMLLMPVLLVGMIKMSGGDFVHNFGTPAGVLSTTIGLVIVAGAYKLGRKITDIEV